MKTQKAEWSYDFGDDILAAKPLKREYDSSLQLGNIIFDLDKQGKVTGFEILDASHMFNIPKMFLKNMISGKISIQVNDKNILVEINVKAIVRNATKTSTLNIERIRPEIMGPTNLRLAVAA